MGIARAKGTLNGSMKGGVSGFVDNSKWKYVDASNCNPVGCAVPAGTL